jgi:glucose-1-phosphate thymidylyltransferase
MRCLILAGGYAKRLWPLTEHTAKSLLVVDGEEILTAIVRKIPDSVPVTVSTNRRYENDFLEWARRIGRRVEIFVEDTREEKEKLGAVSAVSHFLRTKGVEEDLLLIAGDNLFSFSLHDFMAAYAGRPLVAVYDIGDRERARRYGVVEIAGTRIVSFAEKPENPSSTLVSAACYVIPSSFFPTLHEFCARRRDNLGDFVSLLVSKGEVDAFLFSGSWFDVGSLDSFLAAHAGGSSPQIPQSTTVKGKSEIVGNVSLGERCLVVDSRIEDSIVMDDCTIEDSRLRNCVVGKGSVVRHADMHNQVVRGGT